MPKGTHSHVPPSCPTVDCHSSSFIFDKKNIPGEPQETLGGGLLLLFDLALDQLLEGRVGSRVLEETLANFLLSLSSVN